MEQIFIKEEHSDEYDKASVKMGLAPGEELASHNPGSNTTWANISQIIPTIDSSGDSLKTSHSLMTGIDESLTQLPDTQHLLSERSKILDRTQHLKLKEEEPVASTEEEFVNSIDEPTKETKECQVSRKNVSHSKTLVQVVHNRTVSNCSLCHFQTVCKYELRNHFHEHNIELLKCPSCEYQTAYPTELKVHARSHAGRKLKCFACNYTAPYASNLKTHERKHTRDFFNCGACEFKTAYRGDLTRHERKHNGNLLECSFCNYKTPHPGYLKTHVRRHTGDAFKCTLCNFKTPYRNELKKHEEENCLLTC